MTGGGGVSFWLMASEIGGYVDSASAFNYTMPFIL
jgi:hypothetical protein